MNEALYRRRRAGKNAMVLEEMESNEDHNTGGKAIHRGPSSRHVSPDHRISDTNYVPVVLCYAILSCHATGQTPVPPWRIVAGPTPRPYVHQLTVFVASFSIG